MNRKEFEHIRNVIESPEKNMNYRYDSCTKIIVAFSDEYIECINSALEELTKHIDENEQSEGQEIIKIKTHGDISLPVQYGDWIDLRAAETVEFNMLDYKLVSLGVSMKLPDGYYAEVLPRSSTFKNFGIIMANSMGIVDSEYCGNDDVWHFPALAMRVTTIRKGDRIAQFRIMKKQPTVMFEQVNSLNNKNRGGIGSTGSV